MKTFALILAGAVHRAGAADEQPAESDAQKQPRTLGQEAASYIDHDAPKTLEHDYVVSTFSRMRTRAATRSSVVLQIAVPYAGDGDMVSAKCVGMNPPEPITQPGKRAEPEGTTQL